MSKLVLYELVLVKSYKSCTDSLCVQACSSYKYDARTSV